MRKPVYMKEDSANPTEDPPETCIHCSHHIWWCPGCGQWEDKDTDAGCPNPNGYVSGSVGRGLAPRHQTLFELAGGRYEDDV